MHPLVDLSSGHSLRVEADGRCSGLAVVLLHHGLGSVRAWKAQIPALVEAGHYVIAYDRWGYGDSSPRPEISMPAFEDDLADLEELLEIMDLDRISLVGHSDGGTIALYFAARHPERVIHLVTVAAHAYVEPKMEAGIHTVRSAYESDTRFKEGLRRVHGDKADSVFWGWFNGWSRPEVRAWDMRRLLQGITCKTLVVQGMEDEHATPQHARDIAAAIPRADLWLEPGAGHMLPQDLPDVFNRRVEGFLQT